MKKLVIWAMTGIATATVCGLAGLHSLSATVVMVTVFFGAEALIVVALEALTGSGDMRRARK